MYKRYHPPWQPGKDVVSSTVLTLDELVHVIVPMRDLAYKQASALAPSPNVVPIVDNIIHNIMEDDNDHICT